MSATKPPLRSWMLAITFAEAGEWETAQQLLPIGPKKAEGNWWAKIFMAATFAEAGMWEDARHYIEESAPKKPAARDFLATVGLQGVRVRLTYGVLAV